MKSHKLKQISIVLLSGLILSACNNSGDDADSTKLGNNSYKTNSSSSQALQSKKLSKEIIVTIKNEVKFSDIVIVSAAGKEISYDKLKCKNEKQCEIKIARINVSSPLTFKIFDNGKLVSAYILLNITDSSVTILPSTTMLGIYVFEQLKKASKMSPDVLNNKLNVFFKNYNSPDNTANKFEELGLYFIAKVNKGNTGENKFYSDLISSFQKGMILPNKVISPKVQVGLSSTSAAASCNSGVGKFLEYSDKLGSSIPIPGIGAIFSFGNLIFQDTCTAQQDTQVLDKLDKIMDKFDALNQQLDEINAGLSVLNYNVIDIMNTVSSIDASSQLTDIQNDYNQLLSITNTYSSFLDSQGESNILAYVSKNGGLKQAYETTPVLRDELLGQLKAQKTLFSTLSNSNRLNQLSSSLNNMCADPNKITGDVIATRIKCDLVISQVTSMILLSQEKNRLLLKDELNTLLTVEADAKAKGDSETVKWIGKTFANPYGGTWADASKQVDTIMQTTMTNLANAFINKMYMPLDGLDVKLQENMKNKLCYTNSSNGRTKIAGVQAWYQLTPDSNPYIISYCSYDAKNPATDNKNMVKARYNLNQGTEVNNILGVLVSKDDTPRGQNAQMDIDKHVYFDVNGVGKVAYGKSMIISNQELHFNSKGVRQYKDYKVVEPVSGIIGVDEGEVYPYFKGYDCINGDYSCWNYPDKKYPKSYFLKSVGTYFRPNRPVSFGYSLLVMNPNEAKSGYERQMDMSDMIYVSVQGKNELWYIFGLTYMATHGADNTPGGSVIARFTCVSSDCRGTKNDEKPGIGNASGIVFENGGPFIYYDRITYLKDYFPVLSTDVNNFTLTVE